MSLHSLFKKINTANSDSKHYKKGWININCPYCGKGNQHYHLGYHINNQYFNCWSCGKKPLLKTFHLLLGLPHADLLNLLKTAKKRGKNTTFNNDYETNKKPFKIPPNLYPIKGLPQHKLYLKKRGFNWKSLVKKYNIQGTTVLSQLDNIDLSWRIFIPIYNNNEMVTWQTRGIGTGGLPYIACPKDREKINIKALLYPDITQHTVFLTEGLFDMWKVQEAGFNSVCGFGVNLKPKQIKRLSKKRLVIFYDGDDAGEKEAQKIKDRIEFINNQKVQIAKCPKGKDPGKLTKFQILKILRKFI